MSKKKVEAELRELLQAATVAHAMGEADNEAFARARVCDALGRYARDVGVSSPLMLAVSQKDYDAFLDAPTESARRRILSRIAGQALDDIDRLASKKEQPASKKQAPEYSKKEHREYSDSGYKNRRRNNPMANIPTGTPTAGIALAILAYVLFILFAAFGGLDLFR